MSEKRKDFIFLITYIGYASLYIARINLSMAGPDLKAAGVLTTAQLGTLGTAFSVVYATGRLFNSMWADTVEPKTMIGIGLLFTGLASIGVSFLPPFFGILLLWCVNAFAQSMLWSSVLRIIYAMYGEGSKCASRLSLVVSTVAAGQVAGILIAMALLNGPGLRWAFLLPGLVTLAASAAVLLSFPLINQTAGKAAETDKIAAADKTEEADKTEAAEYTESGGNSSNTASGTRGDSSGKGDSPKNPFARMLQLLSINEVRIATVPSAIMGLMKDNVTLWMTVYFVDTYGIDLSATTGYVLFIPLVGLLARLSFPFALRLCGRNEHRVSMLSFAGCFAAALVLVLVKNSLAAVIALSLIYAFMSLTNSSMLSIFPARFAKQGCMAAVSGVMDFVAYLGAGVGSLVYGLTIDSFGYGAMFASWAVLSVIGGASLRLLTTGDKMNSGG